MTNLKKLLLPALLILALLLVACGGDTADTPAAEEPAEAPAAEEPAAEEPAAEEEMAEEEPAGVETAPDPSMGDRVQVRWYVGLGAGSDEPTFDAQTAFVEEFNASQDRIELLLEIVSNDVAYDTLATQIAAGNAPDIVGPVGIRGRDSFKGAWLDMQPLIEKNNYDLSDYDPAMVEFYLVKEEGQLGLPFAIFPSMVLVNLDLFDEAGVPYPPQEYGATYTNIDGVEQDWDIDALTELAKYMTVDSNGNDATNPDFDKESIVQFGYMEKWTDARGVGTLFGPGSLVADDGTAQIPEQWLEAWKWAYDGMWNDVFYPNGPYGSSDILGAGNESESGNLAMGHTHLWYVACCMGNLTASWDFAVVPSYEGTTTAKMHADTFAIPKGSANPDAAFEVLTYMLSAEHAPDLLAIYGGMPARLSLQDTYFQETWPDLDVNWQVVADSMAYADNPNHESYMPSFQETNDKYNEYWNRWVETPGLDLDAEAELLKEDLDRIFAAAGE